MGEDKFELQGDYTESEKAKQVKKEKKSLAAKKASETRKRKKGQKQKEEDAVFWKQQTEKGYKNLFGENNNVKNIKNMANTIRISEENLRNIISEAVANVLAEENIEEGILDFGSQLGAGIKTAVGAKDKGFMDRMKAGYDNFKTKGEINKLENLRKILLKMIEDGEIDPKMPVGKLAGIGSISDTIGQKKAQMKSKGLK